MKTQKAIDTHNDIIDAAKELFMKKSVANVTIREITERAGVAKGTFYLYFESKDDLVWHFLEHALGDILGWFQHLQAFGHNEDDIHRIIDYLVEYVRDHEQVLAMVHHVRFYDFLGQNSMEQRYKDAIIQPVVQWLQRGKDLGKLHIEDVQFTAIYLIITTHDFIDRIICKDVPYSIDDMNTKLRPILMKILR